MRQTSCKSIGTSIVDPAFHLRYDPGRHLDCREFLRTNDAKLRGLIVSSPAAICGVTRAEILHATRDAAHRQTLLTALNMFQHLPFPEPYWDQAGDHLAALRAAGVTISFADALIGTVAIANAVELWTRDRHFTDMQRVVPALRLFQEPP